MKCKAIGPEDARILLVGEAPGENEERKGEPFCGASGAELSRMLHDAGIIRNECRIINVVPWRPPRNKIDYWFGNKTQAAKEGLPLICGKYPHYEILEGMKELQAEIDQLKPELIIPVGNTSLWALTGQWSISKWRGSMMQASKYKEAPIDYNGCDPIIVPTYHPAAILRQWYLRFIAVQDLRRAKKVLEHPEREALLNPKRELIVRPNADQVLTMIDAWLAEADLGQLKLAVDIETRDQHIACIGLAADKHSAICIPLMSTTKPDGYWGLDEELLILDALRRLLSHESVLLLGQNFLYDAQYLVRYLGCWIGCYADTMVMQGVCWPGMSKGLDFISSLYCEYYEYWKDEGKKWDPRYQNEEQLWLYNCLDCINTFENFEELEKVLEARDLMEPFRFEMNLFEPVLATMLRGVKIDLKAREKMALDIMAEQREYEEFFEHVIGDRVQASLKASPWYRSPQQTKALLYDEFGLPVIKHKSTKRPTTDDAALTQIAESNPLLAPLCHALMHYRSLGVYYNNFITAKLRNGRIHCYYNLVGTETFRFASSKDAFDSGTNLQNIPRDE